MRNVRAGRRSSVAALAGAVCLVAATAASALNWQFGSGDWSLSWDTTIGYGQGWRVAKPDCRLIGSADGGCGYSPNIDNGDLNYLARATFSEAATGVRDRPQLQGHGGPLRARQRAL